MRGIDLNWAGAERTFLFPIDLLKALEERCDAGPAWILNRLGNDQWKVNDVVETIRFGLEGGGMDKEEARRIVIAHFRDNKLGGSVITAHAVLMHALYVEDEDTGEAEAAADD